MLMKIYRKQKTQASVYYFKHLCLWGILQHSHHFAAQHMPALFHVFSDGGLYIRHHADACRHAGHTS